jgi:hypothetical protein
MKLTIKTNGKFNDIKIKRAYTETGYNGEIYAVEIDFNPATFYSDLEFWLDDENKKLLDYAKMNLSKRNKMQFSK